MTKQMAFSEVDYKLMDDTVHQICKSLREDPYSWNLSTHTISHRGVCIWIGIGNSFREGWNGHSTYPLFSYIQGELIRAAYNDALAAIGSDNQRRAIAAFQKKERKAQEPSWIEKLWKWLTNI